MSRLTEEQRDDLIRALFEPDDDCAHNMIPLYAAVERIVAEREAADRADERERIASTLLDKWRSLPVWGPVRLQRRAVVRRRLHLPGRLLVSTDEPMTEVVRTPSLCAECHGNDPDACVTCITDAGVWIDGPEWTDEQHAAYARASMGEPNYPPGSPAGGGQ